MHLPPPASLPLRLQPPNKPSSLISERSVDTGLLYHACELLDLDFHLLLLLLRALRRCRIGWSTVMLLGKGQVVKHSRDPKPVLFLLLKIVFVGDVEEVWRLRVSRNMPRHFF